MATAATASPREEHVYMAKLAEQAERYEEMVEFMEKVAAATADSDELSVEERNLLSVAYKNVIGARRASWRIISSIEQKEETRGNDDHVAAIREYRGKIESELTNICNGILRLLDSRLIPSASVGDSKVFYFKMKGDYHRYLAEFKTGADRKEPAENTLAAYKSAQVLENFRIWKFIFFPLPSLHNTPEYLRVWKFISFPLPSLHNTPHNQHPSPSFSFLILSFIYLI